MGGRERKHVLHVDDEVEVAESASAYLERVYDDITVDTAPSATAGIDRLHGNGDVDCIVSDFDMPEMDGLAFLDRVRETWPRLPFILYTGMGSEEIASEAISAGVTDYLQKGTGTDQYDILANRIDNAVTRARAERAERQSRERLRMLFDKAADPIVLHDAQGNMVDFNEKFVDNLGYDRDEVLDTKVWEIEKNGTREELLAVWRDMEPGEPLHFDGRHVRKDGSEFPVEVHVGKMELDGDHLFLAQIRDVAERREAKEALERSERRLRQIIDLLPQFVFVKNVDGTFLLVNQAVAEAYGTTPEELEGKTDAFFAELSDEARQFQEDDREVIESGEPKHIPEERLTTADGTVKILETTKIPFEFATEGEPCVLGVSTDITDRKRTEQELERQRDRFEQFANVLSHDLRNPLNTASSRVELARDDCDSDHLEHVEQMHVRMRELVDDLLTLAKQGRQISETEAGPLTALFESAWATVESNSSQLQLDGVADVQIHCDRTRTCQLLENLFRNAIVHNDEPVTVSVGRLERGFYVEDDGVGLAEAVRDSLFDVEGPSTDGVRGIGLSIVDQIVDAHGWEITATDAASDGARFEISGVDVHDD